MNEHPENMEMKHLMLKRVSTIGFVVVLVWFSLLGGVMLILSGDSIGWLSIVIGVVILLIPLSSPFQAYWATGNAARAYPVIVFAANVGLIFIYGSVLLALLSDPYVFYSDQNTNAVIVWAGAAALSVLALLADIVTFVLDRRGPAENLA